MTHGRYSLRVDGTDHATDDATLDGRQVRVSAHLVPPSAFVLIRTDRGIAESVGLEEQVALEPGVPAVFHSFESDRTFSLTVDERGWEWGAPSIGEHDIRGIAGVPDDHELYLDSDHDRPIARGGTVGLDGSGVERVGSRRVPRPDLRIIVNGREREVPPGTITFERLIELAFPVPPAGQQVSFTVSFRKGPRERPEGSLLPGQSVALVDGMTFNVTATDKS